MIKVENLVAGYDKLTIIRDVNIHVKNGEIVSIIGRNGVGKSTFIKTIIGLIETKSGSIHFKRAELRNSWRI
jgi:ABC-type branched-subunit amino acid transport system ATPase component